MCHQYTRRRGPRAKKADLHIDICAHGEMRLCFTSEPTTVWAQSAESQRPLLPLRALSSRARWAAGGVPMTLSHIPPLSLVVMSLRFISLTPHCRRHPRELQRRLRTKRQTTLNRFQRFLRLLPLSEWWDRVERWPFQHFSLMQIWKKKKNQAGTKKKRSLLF